jgi:hypothetical protein
MTIVESLKRLASSLVFGRRENLSWRNAVAASSILRPGDIIARRGWQPLWRGRGCEYWDMVGVVDSGWNVIWATNEEILSQPLPDFLSGGRIVASRIKNSMDEHITTVLENILAVEQAEYSILFGNDWGMETRDVELVRKLWNRVFGRYDDGYALSRSEIVYHHHVKIVLDSADWQSPMM